MAAIFHLELLSYEWQVLAPALGSLYEQVGPFIESDCPTHLAPGVYVLYSRVYPSNILQFLIPGTYLQRECSEEKKPPNIHSRGTVVLGEKRERNKGRNLINDKLQPNRKINFASFYL